MRRLVTMHQLAHRGAQLRDHQLLRHPIHASLDIGLLLRRMLHRRLLPVISPGQSGPQEGSQLRSGPQPSLLQGRRSGLVLQGLRSAAAGQGVVATAEVVIWARPQEGTQLYTHPERKGRESEQ